MTGYFQQKRIWITGASSGIGEALALAFAAQKAQLVLSSRKVEELERVAKLCLQAGAAQVLVRPLDLAQHANLPEIAQEVLRQVGKIDILVNNGGISQRAMALETELSVDKRIMDINYFGTIALTKSVLPSMVQHQLGHIVVLSSLMGKFGAPYRTAYAASKHALHGFFDSLRAELAQSPIRVTLICPGYVRTNVSINALRGDGDALGSMDDATEKGMDPVWLAGKILNAIQKEQEEVYFGGKEMLGIYLKRFFPRYLSKIVAKAKVR